MGSVLSRMVHRSEDTLHDFCLTLADIRRARLEMQGGESVRMRTTAAENREVCTQTNVKECEDVEIQADIAEMVRAPGTADLQEPETCPAHVSTVRGAGLHTAATRFVFPDVTSSKGDKTKANPSRDDYPCDETCAHRNRFLPSVGCSSPLYTDEVGFKDQSRFKQAQTYQCVSGSHDVQIIENPDFTSFGDPYKSLSSPRDRSTGEPRCRCVSSLSPVKEEAETDPPGNTRSPDSTLGDITSRRLSSTASLNETFPVFDDVAQESLLLRRGAGMGGGSFLCKRQFYLSASSDSGIGERLRSSSTLSSTASSGGCISVSDASERSRSSSDSSVGSHAEELLDNRQCNIQNPKAFQPNPYLYSDQDSEQDDDAFHPEDETPQPELLGTNRPQTGPALQALPAPMSIRARRKVDFTANLRFHTSSDRFAFANTSAAIPRTRAARKGGPLSPPEVLLSGTNSLNSSTVTCTPPSVEKSSWLLGSHRSAFFQRQDSSDSSSSSSLCGSSSSDSVLAVPFSPRSPDSPTLTSSFAFPEDPGRSFSEWRDGCDLVLVAEGRRFYVHSSIVAWQCHTLLTHLRQTGSDEVLLSDRRARDLSTFLGLLYPLHHNSLDERNVEAVLDLSRYLGCERVRRTCVTYLLGLANFPHLCTHRHLLPGAQRSRARRQRFESTDSSDGRTSASEENDNFRFKREPEGPRLFSRTSTTTSLCACAETMVERVLSVLDLAVRYEQEDVYNSFLEVAAKLRTEDLHVCSRYQRLSPSVREDILMARLQRLEATVSCLGVCREDLVTCRKSRHDHFRVTYRGQLCLRCMSKSALRRALQSTS